MASQAIITTKISEAIITISMEIKTNITNQTNTGIKSKNHKTKTTKIIRIITHRIVKIN